MKQKTVVRPVETLVTGLFTEFSQRIQENYPEHGGECLVIAGESVEACKKVLDEYVKKPGALIPEMSILKVEPGYRGASIRGKFVLRSSQKPRKSY